MGKFWKCSEDEYLSVKYPHKYAKEIASHLGRSMSSVYSRVVKLGLKKSEEFKKMELAKQAERLRIVGEKSRYQKGREPENKGKKMPKEVYEKCRPTMFQKGNVPHNTKYDGYERVNRDGYKEVRVSKGKFQLKHRIVWEQKFGEIPPDHAVIFKNGDTLDFTIENLRLVSREELMKMNSFHRYPEHIKDAIRTLAKLRKTIKTKYYEKQD